jgi:hypothetical protein
MGVDANVFSCFERPRRAVIDAVEREGIMKAVIFG